MAEKTTYMTCLNARETVFKAHPRIELRGRLDSLAARTLAAAHELSGVFRAPLGDALSLLQMIVSAEYTGKPLADYALDGMNADQVRDASHHPERFGLPGHAAPTLGDGRDAAHLNELRAAARETEVCACRAFGEAGAAERADILCALNRLSSFFYVLQLRAAARARQEIQQQHSGEEKHMQVIYAHRGASGYAPENTLEAFALAAEMGAFGVELDTHLTRDGEIVVTHDERIDRVSTGTGFVRDMTCAELKHFSFGKLFPDYCKARIPTLREVYELLKPTGLHVNVELKNSNYPYPGMEEACVALAEEMGMTDRVLYSSFNHYSLLRVKEINPAIPCGLLYGGVLARPWDYAKALNVNALHPNMNELRYAPDECARAHALGIEVNPWTVNEEADIRFVLQAGADRVITNYPDRALRVMKSLA